MKKLFVYVWALLLFLPGATVIMTSLTDTSWDVQLKGYPARLQRPELTADGLLAGEFQKSCSAWLEQQLPVRGRVIRSYATLRYKLFDLGNSHPYRPVAKNHDLYDQGYIDSELLINTARLSGNERLISLLYRADMSKAANRREMEAFVGKLQLLQERLARHNKYLYVYITPNKADFHRGNIPEKYLRLASPESVKPVDYFAELIKNTGIKYRICRDAAGELEYPAFYTTGIHWSRTFEQRMSAAIIEDLTALTGKPYQPVILENARMSARPFWRDADLYNLLNVWEEPDGQEYYEYDAGRPPEGEKFVPLRALMSGTSYGEGLLHDLHAVYPENNEVFMINRDSFIMNTADERTPFSKDFDWKGFDFAPYLSEADVVIIESTETELTGYSYGFVDALNNYLEGKP